MAFADVGDKLKILTKLIDEINKLANTNAVNIIERFDAAQGEGSTADFLFPNYIGNFSKLRADYAKLFVSSVAAQNNIVRMFGEEINSTKAGLALLRDLQKYMHDNAESVLRRNITRGATAYVSSNAGYLVTHNIDWLGYAIETGRTFGAWTLRCVADQHDSPSHFFGGQLKAAPNTLVVNADAITPGFVLTYPSIKGINASSNGNTLVERFNNYSDISGFSGWNAAAWTNIKQSLTEFLHENINTRSTSNPNGTGDSGYMDANTSMRRYINNLAFDRHVPYLITLAYKHQNTTADGRLTLRIGSESVQSPADGLTGALTGTATFSGANNQLVGLNSLFLSELKPGDLVWNSTDDAIAQAYTVVSVEDNLNATMSAVYGGTAGGGKAYSAKHTGWHHISMVKYLDEFWVDNLFLEIEKTGHGAGNIYFDEFILKPMAFFPELGRYIEFIADSVDMEKDDSWTWTDALVGADSINQRWFTRQFGISLPHSGAPTILDPA